MLQVTHRRLSEAVSNKSSNFAMLRFFLASLIVYSHSFVILKTQGEIVASLSHGQVVAGRIALHSFFIMSGFLITISLTHSKGTLDYLKKRFIRIYPGFVAAMLFCALVVGPLVATSAGTYFHAFALQPFLSGVAGLSLPRLPEVLTHRGIVNQLNGSVWSLRIEFEYYLLVPLLGLAGFFKKRSWLLALFVMFYALKIGYQFMPYGFFFAQHERQQMHIRLGTYFLSGVVFYIFAEKIQLNFRLFVLSLGAFLVGLLWDGYAVIAPLALAYLLFYVAYWPNQKFTNWAKYGDFSYGIYLYSWPFQVLIAYYTWRHLSVEGMFLASFTASLTAAILSWYFVEKPFLKFKAQRQASNPDRSVPLANTVRVANPVPGDCYFVTSSSDAEKLQLPRSL